MTIEQLEAEVAALKLSNKRLAAALVAALSVNDSGPVEKTHVGPQAPGAGPGGPEAGTISRAPDLEGARAAADEALRRVRLNRGRREAK